MPAPREEWVIRAIIVDDEPPARREMRRLLSAHPGVTVVGESADLAGARGLLARTRPDLVFLDIRLNRSSGFDLLPDVEPETAVVFVTAYDRYAVQAFEASALDYLVKPVEPERLALSIRRLEERLAGRAAAPGRGPSAGAQPFTPRHWVFLDSGDRQEFLEIAAITHITAERGGSRVCTRDGAVRVVGRSLRDWEERLPPGDFVRVHRSTLVNLRHVERVEPWFHYGYRVHLHGFAEPVIMSRRQANRLRDLLG